MNFMPGPKFKDAMLNQFSENHSFFGDFNGEHQHAAYLIAIMCARLARDDTCQCGDWCARTGEVRSNGPTRDGLAVGPQGVLSYF